MNMNELKQLADIPITEGLTPFKNIEKVLDKQGFTTMQMNGYEHLALMDKAGFKIKYDLDKGVGTASLAGFKIEISMGSEGMHISKMDQISVKGGEPELISALVKLIKIANNYS